MLFAALSRRMPADGGPYAIGAVGGGMAVTLFSYLGVETASVAAAEVRDPSRNVPRATILSTLATAVVYVPALVAVLGILKDRRTAGAQVVDDHRQRSEQRR
jgi:basic amino acid/polyamine antiporter, APA family